MKRCFLFATLSAATFLVVIAPALSQGGDVGRVIVAHATLDADSMRTELGADAITIGRREVRIRYPIDTPSTTGRVSLDSGDGYFTIGDTIPVIGDTTTLLMAIGSSARPYYRLLAMYSPAHRDPLAPGPYLRIANALTDSITVDIAGLNGPRTIQELRARPFEWTEQVAIYAGHQRYEFQHVAGARYFAVADTLRDDHRYTMVLVGTLAAPTLLMLDEWGDSAQVMREVPINQGAARVYAPATGLPAVRPNPANEFIEVLGRDGSGPVDLELVDAFGRVALRASNSGRVTRISVAGLAVGSYTVVARADGTATWRLRVIVVR